MADVKRLQKFIDSPNIAEDLDSDRLAEIGQKVVDEYEIDEDSRSEWMKRNEDAMELAMQVSETKDFPWENAANVKHPVLTIAALQFNARSYPEIIKGRQVVKGFVVGADPDGEKFIKASRVARHMSYQLLEEMPSWEEDMDRMLVALPILGCYFKKTYYSVDDEQNHSELVPPADFVVNYDTKSLESAPRVTHVLSFYPHEIVEKQRLGQWLEYEDLYGMDGEKKLPADEDSDQQDEDALQTILEQHRLLDLDDDGLKEPYVVTVHRASKKVLRIAARYSMEGIRFNRRGQIAKIQGEQHFTKFSFIPSPDGGFYDVGFGQLIGPLTEAINTLVNQMLDAGTLANLGGGFIGTGSQMKGGNLRFALGEWKKIAVRGGNLRENIVPLEFRGPSAVLFSLLGALVETVKDITSVKDVLLGSEPKSNVPATTTMALIEQGLQVYNAIYKRIYRSLKIEYKKIYRLNARYLPQQVYFQYADEPEAIAKSDYNNEANDVLPVADPGSATKVLRMAKAQALMPLAQDPDFDRREIKRRYLEAMDIEGIDKLFVPIEKLPQPPPDPKLIEAMTHRISAMGQLQRVKADIHKVIADAIKSMAEAEQIETANMLQAHIEQLKAIEQYFQAGESNGENNQAGGQGMGPGNPNEEGV